MQDGRAEVRLKAQSNTRPTNPTPVGWVTVGRRFLKRGCTGMCKLPAHKHPPRIPIFNARTEKRPDSKIPPSLRPLLGTSTRTHIPPLPPCLPPARLVRPASDSSSGGDPAPTGHGYGGWDSVVVFHPSQLRSRSHVDALIPEGRDDLHRGVARSLPGIPGPGVHMEAA